MTDNPGNGGQPDQGAGSSTSQGEGQQQQPNGGAGGGTQQQQQQGSGDGDRTFSQDELNKILAKERREWAQKYGDDETREKAAKFDELQQAAKSDLEKANEAKSAAEKERDGFKTELHGLRATLAIERTAAGMGVIDPEAAAQLVDRDELTMGDDGRPTKESATKALESLIEAKPWLKGQQGGARPQGSGDGGSRQPGSPSRTFSDTIRDQVRSARGTGG